MSLRPKSFFILGFLSFLSFFLYSSYLDSSGHQEEPRSGGTLRIRTFSPVLVPSLDPLTANSDASLIIDDQVFEGLVRFNPNLQIVPDLADYWVISPDGTRYTFYLKKGIQFHHGSSFRAQDVKKSLERLITPEAAGFSQYFVERVIGAREFYRGEAKEVEGFIVRDDYTFEIQLLQPYLPLLSVLAAPFCKVMPADLLASQGKKFFFKPSGTGPYKFAYWLRDSRLNIIGVRLERNENYHGHRPYLEALEFSASFSLDQFEEKQVDIIPYYSRTLSRTECQVLESDSFRILYLGFSCHLAPFNSLDVRQAVALALDKRELARSYFTFESMPQVLNNIIHPRLPGFFPLDSPLERDILQAKRLLNEAGYYSPADFPVIEFYTLKSDRWRAERLYQKLKEQLSPLGISPRWKLVSGYNELRQAKNAYLVLFSWTLDFPDPENIIRPVFSLASAVNQNVFHYKNERLEMLLARSEKEKSWGRRNELFREMEALLLKDLPVIPLFLINQRLAIQRYVKGIKVPAFGFSFLDMSRVWIGEPK
ncbi:MAG: ABC transporter substrate-binding protein [Candidatus Aminicenantales bacterium]